MGKIKTVIVDDETGNRRLIRKLITELHTEFVVVGEARNINEAYDTILQEKPKVVFLDIKMPGGSGFELLERFDQINFEVAFITGFDSYAVQAFEFNALDYILKPVNPLKFSKALERIHNRIKSTGGTENSVKETLQTFDAKKAIVSKIAVHTGTKVILLNVSDLVCVQSEEGYVCFRTKEGERYVSSKELNDFAFILEKHHFMLRISKSVYVNINFVTGYTKGEPCVLLLKNDISFEIPRRKKTEVLSMIFGS